MFNKTSLNFGLYVTDHIVSGYKVVIGSTEVNSFQKLLNKCLKTKNVVQSNTKIILQIVDLDNQLNTFKEKIHYTIYVFLTFV